MIIKLKKRNSKQIVNKFKRVFEKVKNKVNFKNILLNEIKSNSELSRINEKKFNIKNYINFGENPKENLEFLNYKLEKLNHKKFKESEEYDLNIFKKTKTKKINLFKIDKKNEIFKTKQNINYINLKKINIKNIKLINLKKELNKKFIWSSSSLMKKDKINVKLKFNNKNRSSEFKNRSNHYNKKINLFKIKKESSRIRINKINFKLKFKI